MARQPTNLEQMLIGETGFWGDTQESFNENPNDSVLRQNISQRIYPNMPNNQNFFVGTPADVVNDQIKNQNDTADAYWINYTRDNTRPVLELFDTEHLFHNTALKFFDRYMQLISVKNNPHAKKAVLLNKFHDALTDYSASNGDFLERLYESSVGVEYRIARQDLSAEGNPANGLDGERVIDHVLNGVSRLDSNTKDSIYVDWAKQLYHA